MHAYKWWRFVVIGPEDHVASDFVRHLLWLIGDNVVVVLDKFELDNGKMSRLHASNTPIPVSLIKIDKVDKMSSIMLGIWPLHLLLRVHYRLVEGLLLFQQILDVQILYVAEVLWWKYNVIYWLVKQIRQENFTLFRERLIT
jgi:hypothetical protein